MLGQPQFIEAPRHLAQGKQGLPARGECKMSGSGVIIEGAISKMVARDKPLSLVRPPARESPVPIKPRRGPPSPSLKCRRNNSRFAEGLGPRQVQFTRELFPVVQTAGGYHDLAT